MKSFSKHIGKIKALEGVAHDYLVNIPAKTWSRHAFNPKVKSNMLLSNVAKTFNLYILEVRDKSIITLLEIIRRIFIKRFYQKREKIKEYDHNICPRIMKSVEKAKKQCMQCIVILKANDRFKVSYW